MGRKWHTTRIVLLLALSGLFCLEEGHQALARSVKEKKVEKQAASEAETPRDRGATTPPSKVRSKQPTRSESTPLVAQEPAKGSVPRDRKTRRQAPKKLPPKAVVEPKPDLSYMGKFEQPQRYDPSRAYRKGGPPNPQAGDVLHEHFQELDRNRDGIIDPLERASSRLDIDRDLANREWQ